MATLQDVAKKAGVSTATVSKVLSNTPYFTEATRQRVMQAAADLGYRPNLAARALSSGRTGIIAVVFPRMYDPIFKDPRILQVLEGVEQVITQTGYHLLLSTPSLTENGLEEQFCNLVASGYLEGMLAFDVARVNSVRPSIPETLPLVTLGHYPAENCVTSDDYRGGRLLMQHLLDYGHERIGIISVPSRIHMAVDERLRGLREAAVAADLDFDSLPLVHSDFSAQGGASATATLMAAYPHLTAIIGINDRIALGAVQHLQSAGKHIPTDISVVGYDNIAMSAVSSPALTTIDQQSGRLGTVAARMLLDILNGESPQPVTLAPLLMVRESSAPVR